MITLDQVRALSGRDVYGPDNEKIGSVGQVWEDGAGQPTWASVKTGLFGLNESFVPLRDADVDGDRLVLPFGKAKVKDAPNVDVSHDEPLTQDDVERLYDYYGMSWQDSSRAYQAGAAAGTANYTGTTREAEFSDRDASFTERDRDASFADRDRDASFTDRDRDRDGDRDWGRDDDAMTRSEERLAAGTQREETGRARLRKYVVTEQEHATVPVEREEVRLEREPITEGNRGAAFSGPDITESEHEVTLHAERPVVETETVPVERVRLGKETVTDEETVSGEVRKERIEADMPGERGRRDLD
ncbi:photosystem reaction center subunit H [Paractinoplanes deccanensis]|uniref:Photosystem reaction center subunit H n=1 Tax=Paractinoplanes deccanensis TaxID=113561 RepID=A0ABQ3YAN0_9ACTN|nr:PRC and DUF2382 domain-containing protein [Actinoplanes deccanensis]GID77069.1 photosystem reaction center subunit H [Actinoplanes deccanensis]